MTYIEFFDKTAAENVISCLTQVPDRVILLGDDRALLQQHAAWYTRVFRDRGHDIEFLPKSVSKSKLDHAVAVLTELVETYEDCVFDVTGGGELLLLALGIVYSRYPDRNIQIHKCNLDNNMIYDCDKDGVTIRKDTPRLTVDEQIRIYGGDVVYGTAFEEKTYRWELTPEFRRDVELIWNCCKVKPRLWNAQIGTFAAMEKVGTHSPDGLTTTASIPAVKMQLVEDRGNYTVVKGLIGYLQYKGLLTAFSEDEQQQTITVSYKDPQIRRCLIKAGQALEMRVYLAALELEEEDGTPVYNDVRNGVLIDWDGVCHDEQTEQIFDTENEIDVLLLHNSLPVFISCKNGVVTSDELYKLTAVAQRFGGGYAKKVLVATSLPDRGEPALYLRQRIEDMDIILIEKDRLMNDEQLRRRLKTLLCD